MERQSLSTRGHLDKSHDKEYPFDRPHTTISDPSKQQHPHPHIPHQHQQQQPRTSAATSVAQSLYPLNSTSSQQQQQQQQQQQHNTQPQQQQHGGAAYPLPMYSSAHQSKLHGQPNQPAPASHHSFQQSQQPSEHQPQIQRGTVVRVQRSRTISTPAWISSANPGLHLHSTSSSAASDSELTMASALPRPDASSTPCLRWDITAMLDWSFVSCHLASGIVGHPSSAHMSSSASAHSYLPLVRSTTIPIVLLRCPSDRACRRSTRTTRAPARSSNGLSYSSSISAPLTSPPGFVYGPSGSSAAPPLGRGLGTTPIPFLSSAHSQYVSYLPPALSHDSHFYPLNPFEIKHRRRTTKTQFRVLESTFQSQSQSQGHGKKRQTSEGNTSTDTSQDRQRPAQDGVANHHLYSDAGERRGQQPPELPMYDDANRDNHLVVWRSL
ncbi:uncharacterized protein UTRI_02313 [Ustilago trichophora]|uniref:Uncharacterized protein n=1 Tax=Ustilago trichophora TaxID=86804 RepID=A0A5C3E9Z9_9BASI|nr:uncharacterized protein UTRI_02313 [Ustilago trichophora]